jgi:monofunctional glycosyltransferase
MQRTWRQRLLRALAWTVLGWLALSVTLVLLLRFVNPPTTAFILRDRIGAWWNDEPNYQFRQQWMPSTAIAWQLKLAVIASEDQKFLDHHGFDFESIEKALDSNQQRKRPRGASTLSQQVAKNLFLWPGRSYLRKGIEAYFTVLIEALWSKQRILEVYLNIAEFGRGTYGAQAATQAFFKKPCARLSSSEAALMAVVLPNPRRFKVQKPSAFIKRRAAFIQNQMSMLGSSTVQSL